jgi:hypothetical protein
MLPACRLTHISSSSQLKTFVEAMVSDIITACSIVVALDAAFAYEEEASLPSTVRSAFLREEFVSSDEYRLTNNAAKDRCLGLVRSLVAVFPAAAVPCYLRVVEACGSLRERLSRGTTLSQAYCDVSALSSVLDAMSDAFQPIVASTLDGDLKSVIGNALVEALKMWLK